MVQIDGDLSQKQCRDTVLTPAPAGEMQCERWSLPLH